MNLLLIVPSYPHQGLPLSGAFNEKSAIALKELGAGVQVLAPRPYVPPWVSRWHPRWRVYREIPGQEIKNGIPIVRPRIPVIPWLETGFWLDPGAFAAVYRASRNLHRRIKFDAILSFDLVSAGGIAWRIARSFGIPAAGWATGGDVRFVTSSAYGKVARRALRQLDMVFYQSHELRGKAASLLGIDPSELENRRHVVLPRGVPAPPSFNRSAARQRARAALGVNESDVLVLSVGRLGREKGIYELLKSSSLALSKNSALAFRFIGAASSFDESERVQKEIDRMVRRDRVAVLPACAPEKVWEYLSAADIFAFASHQEGMPNSLLEAMAMALPSVAFAIPPVVEIDGAAGALLTVPALDTNQFAAALVALADSPAQRAALGERARRRVFERFLITQTMGEALTRLSELTKLSRVLQARSVSKLPRSAVAHRASR